MSPSAGAAWRIWLLCAPLLITCWGCSSSFSAVEDAAPDSVASDEGAPVELGGADLRVEQAGVDSAPPTDLPLVQDGAGDAALDQGHVDGSVDAAPPSADVALFDLLPPSDGSKDQSPASDQQGLPPKSCRPLPVPCLDPAPLDVIEVPSESTLASAFAAAKAGDTVQVKGLSLGAGWKVPPFVTLRGCSGASIAGAISFVGSGGTVEGFEVSGQVVANASGGFTLRHNRFVGSSQDAGVSVRVVDGMVSASITAVVEANWFQGRDRGVEARTYYDTGTREIDITIRNNLFSGVARPISISETGLVGKITAAIEHNTLYDFTDGIWISNVAAKVPLRGNLLVKGSTAVQGNSVYELSYSASWQVTSQGIPPLSGGFASADPQLVDPAAGDLRPGASSAVVDVIPASAPMPGEDYYGCIRPVALTGSSSLGDIGAVELQP